MEMMRQTPSSSVEVGDDGESAPQPATKIIAKNNNFRLTIPVYNAHLTGRTQLVNCFTLSRLMHGGYRTLADTAARR